MNIAKIRKVGGVCAVMMAAVLLTGIAWAQPSGGEPEKSKEMQERGKKHFAEMSEKLKLTAEQQAKLDQNREQRRKEFDTLRTQMSAKRKELRKALEAPELDMANVTKIHQELKNLMGRMEDQHLAAVLEIRQILTPEQFAQFQAMAPDRGGPPQGHPPREEGERDKPSMREGKDEGHP